MEIIFSRLDDNSCRFQIGPVNPSFANALRRAMIGEVPTLAIENVRIYDNTSALFDEMLAHRLGLIPIRTDLTSYVKREECSCSGEGCPVMYGYVYHERGGAGHGIFKRPHPTRSRNDTCV